MTPRTVGAVAIALAALAAGAACVTSVGRTIERAPDEATFAAVQPVLMRNCGTLDCHGTLQRNFRVFGAETLRLDRLDAGHRPLRPPESTPEELAEDYQSVVGLEPQAMSDVVASGGANPERLTLVRKGRGTEAHKGGAVWPEGSEGDTCITSWLAGKVDTALCAASSRPLGSEAQ